MARPIDEIYNEIVATKDTFPDLQGGAPQNDSFTNLRTELSSNSKVAIWRLWAYLVALAIHTHEVLQDEFKAEVEQLVAASPAGTLPWYRDQVLKFQLGDSLQFIDERFQYAEIDSTKQIVKLCAVSDLPNGNVVIKVAKLTNGLPAPLSTTEKSGLEAYLQKIKFAGTSFLIISENADKLKLQASVYYDGLFNLSDLKTRIEGAIQHYLQNLTFDGVFKVNSLIDSVQAVEGVTDFTIQVLEATYGNLPYTPVNRVYTPNAGYLEIDSAFPLSTNINYIQE